MLLPDGKNRAWVLFKIYDAPGLGVNLSSSSRMLSTPPAMYDSILLVAEKMFYRRAKAEPVGTNSVEDLAPEAGIIACCVTFLSNFVITPVGAFGFANAFAFVFAFGFAAGFSTAAFPFGIGFGVALVFAVDALCALYSSDSHPPVILDLFCLYHPSRRLFAVFSCCIAPLSISFLSVCLSSAILL